jgi:choline kinase
MKALILAHNNDKFVGLRKPRAFLNLYGKTCLQHLYEQISNIGISQFGLAVGYGPEWFEQFAINNADISVIQNQEWDVTGSLQTLYNAVNFINEDFLLVESHLVCEPYCWDFVVKIKPDTCVQNCFHFVSLNTFNKMVDECPKILKNNPKANHRPLFEKFNFVKVSELAYDFLENQESLENALKYVLPRI